MPVGRRRARREALFLLYQADLLGLGGTEVIARGEESGVLADPYTRTLVEGVLLHREGLDAILGRHLQEWSVSRLAPLERNILRMAAFELSSGSDVPASVAIDEAVTLAKRHCSEDAGSLVNGVLAAVEEELGRERRDG